MKNGANLKLSGSAVIVLVQDVGEARFPILAKSGRHWIVSSDLKFDGESILTSIYEKCAIKSTLNIRLTPV